MFDTLLLITLFLLASLHVCLLTLFMSLFPFITDINGFFEIPPPTHPPVYFDTLIY